METLATIGFSLAVAAYSIASTLYFLGLRARATALAGRPGAIALGAGAVFHGVHVVAASIFSHVCPVESIQFALSGAGLVTVVAFLFIARERRLDALGALVAPLALSFLVATEFVGPTVLEPGISRVLLAFHITSSLLGFAVVMLAGAAAGFYLFVEGRLKAKRLPAVGRLPSLEVLDSVGHRLLLVGFPLLTFTVVTGGMFFAQLERASGDSLTRVLLGYATWALVAAVLLVRALWGWRGRRSAYGTLAGVMCLALVLLVYLLRPLLGGAV
jgi:ABC-type uncharacterized transport system permease subunit